MGLWETFSLDFDSRRRLQFSSIITCPSRPKPFHGDFGVVKWSDDIRVLFRVRFFDTHKCRSSNVRRRARIPGTGIVSRKPRQTLLSQLRVDDRQVVPGHLRNAGFQGQESPSHCARWLGAERYFRRYRNNRSSNLVEASVQRT